MPQYDTTAYDPPAPVAIVSLRNMEDGTAVIHDVPLLIDTGADVTLLPRAALARLGVTPIPGLTYDLYGFDGTRTAAEAVALDLQLLGQTFRGRYLITDEPHGLLGRDVLNALRLTFDGPRLVWDAG